MLVRMRVRRLYGEGVSLRGYANSCQRTAATVPSRHAVLVGPFALRARRSWRPRSRDRQRASDVTVAYGQAGHLLLHVGHGGGYLAGLSCTVTTSGTR
ncbi:hypothetical protein MRX96_028723 [Rhipicephalus microplus]